MTDDGRLIAGRYRLTARLGSGGMGVVWQARDERLNRPVAVKRLFVPSYLTGPEAEQAKLRAMRESRIAARIQHPNVVAIYDVVEDDGHPCLVMEYVQSRSLAEVLAERGSLTPAEVARIGVQMAQALASAHAAGVVHRDIKPANVLLGVDGMAKLVDFGIARAVGDVTLTATGLISGTPAYLAPEVARGGDATFASDVFSLGSTLYAAVEGEPPFGRDENAIALLHKVASGVIRPPRRAGPLTGVLLRLLHVRPEQRPTMAQAAVALANVVAGFAPTQRLAALAATETSAAETDQEAVETRALRPAAESRASHAQTAVLRPESTSGEAKVAEAPTAKAQAVGSVGNTAVGSSTVAVPAAEPLAASGGAASPRVTTRRGSGLLDALRVRRAGRRAPVDSEPVPTARAAEPSAPGSTDAPAVTVTPPQLDEDLGGDTARRPDDAQTSAIDEARVPQTSRLSRPAVGDSSTTDGIETADEAATGPGTTDHEAVDGTAQPTTDQEAADPAGDGAAVGRATDEDANADQAVDSEAATDEDAAAELSRTEPSSTEVPTTEPADAQAPTVSSASESPASAAAALGNGEVSERAEPDATAAVTHRLDAVAAPTLALSQPVTESAGVQDSAPLGDTTPGDTTPGDTTPGGAARGESDAGDVRSADGRSGDLVSPGPTEALTPVPQGAPLATTWLPGQDELWTDRTGRRWVPVVVVVVLLLALIGAVVAAAWAAFGDRDTSRQLDDASKPSPQVSSVASAPPSSTPTPTPSPSASPTAAPTVTVTVTVPPPSSPPAQPPAPASKVAAITEYYALMPHQLEVGWARLTPRYQQRTARGFGGYQSFWNQMASVSVTNVRDAGGNRVTAQVTYVRKDGRVFVERHLYTLVNQGGQWLIDASSVLSSVQR